MNEQPGEAMLETLRAEGLQRHNPARFHYLEVLAQRLPGQPAAVQQVLAPRLEQAVATYASEARSAATAAVTPVTGAPPTTAAPSPLAQLNRDLRARASAEPHAATTDPLHAGAGAHPSDMKSVRQFSEVWSKISAEQQVVQALHRGPENAGPLNSHKLVLRSLSLMRALSPDYLRRFMSQMEALLWLDQAGTRAPAQAARTPRKGRGKV